MPKPTTYKTFRLTEEENQLLEDYCKRVGRTYTDVLRELVRSLPTRSPQLGKSKQIAEMLSLQLRKTPEEVVSMALEFFEKEYC